MDIKVLLSIFLCAAIVYIIILHIRLWQVKRMLSRISYENTCSLLSINGQASRLDYSRFPDLWRAFSKENNDTYAFVELAAEVITKQVKSYDDFCKVVDHLSSFDIIMRNKTISPNVRFIVETVHEKVAEATTAKVISLASSKFYYLKTMEHSDDRESLTNRFKIDLSFPCIRKYYQISYDLFEQRDKERVK